MPLRYRPHTATIKTGAETVADSIVGGVTRAGSGTIRGMLDTARVPDQVVAQWGVDSTLLGVWFCNIVDATFRAGDRLVIGGVAWMVLADPQKSDAEPRTAHAHCPVKRMELT